MMALPFDACRPSVTTTRAPAARDDFLMPFENSDWDRALSLRCYSDRMCINATKRTSSITTPTPRCEQATRF